MAAMFGQCLSLVTNCLYGEGGGEWGGPVPPIPASQRIPEVILDTVLYCILYCTVLHCIFNNYYIVLYGTVL